MPAKAKLTDEQVKKIRRRVRAGERLTDLAAEYGVNRKTIRRRLDAAERGDAERARRTAAKRAEEKRMKRLLGHDYRNPDRAPEYRRESHVADGEGRAPSRSSKRSGRRGDRGVPLFPKTRKGQAKRFAYYEARKLNHLPHSLYDYNDVIRGRETPAERRTRQAGASGRLR